MAVVVVVVVVVVDLHLLSLQPLPATQLQPLFLVLHPTAPLQQLLLLQLVVQLCLCLLPQWLQPLPLLLKLQQLLH